MNDEGDVDAVLFCYGTFIVFFSGSDYEFAQGVIMNDEGDAVEFSPRNARKVWSSEKKEVIGFIF